MLQRMDGQFLMTFEDYQIMPVSLVVTEEQVLAMGGIDFLPILQSKLYGRKRRMSMQFIFKSMSFKEGQDFIYTGVSCHFTRLFA